MKALPKLLDAQKRLHAKGATDAQMQEAMAIYAEFASEAQMGAQEAMAQEAKATEGALRQEFGDKYEAQMRSVTAIAETLGIKDTLIQNGLGNNLAVIKMFSE